VPKAAASQFGCGRRAWLPGIGLQGPVLLGARLLSAMRSGLSASSSAMYPLHGEAWFHQPPPSRYSRLLRGRSGGPGGLDEENFRGRFFLKQFFLRKIFSR
jgi:hypothetical protein